MVKISRLAALLLAGFIVSAPALAADKSKVMATVNGEAIPKAEFDAFINQQKAQGKPDSPQLHNAVREELITRAVIAQEAKKKGFDKQPEIQGQMALAQQAVLIGAFLSDYARTHPISEESLKAEYDSIKTHLGNTEYKARHILVDNEDEAKAIIAKLDKGAKFADLAKESKDPGSKDHGGELNWSSPSAFVKPFGDALAKLKKGEYTKTPVKTEFGYHVIELDDTRPLASPPYEQVRGQLLQHATKAQAEKLVKELRAKAKVN